MANVPFANAPQHTSSLTGDYLIGIQVGITQDAAGLPEMKYIRLSQLKNFLALEYGRLWNYRGEFDSITGTPSNPVLNDSFYCSGTFTEDGVTYTAGHLYAYNADGDWGDISDVLNQYALANNVYSKVAVDNMFYLVNQEIANLKARGRFLSLWNSATGLPVTDPPGTLPYEYNSGDYYVVSTVDSTTNYRPNGSDYDGTASTTVETGDVAVGDTYFYDGTNWLLLLNTVKVVTFAQIAGSPRDNVALDNEFRYVVKHSSNLPGTAAPINADQLNGHSDTYFGSAGNLAMVETSPTTSAHSTGDLIVYNGVLYKVLSNISVGATLTVGTNIQGNTVSDSISDLIASLNGVEKTVSFTSGVTGSMKAYVVGKFCFVIGYFATGASSISANSKLFEISGVSLLSYPFQYSFIAPYYGTKIVSVKTQNKNGIVYSNDTISANETYYVNSVFRLN